MKSCSCGREREREIMSKKQSSSSKKRSKGNGGKQANEKRKLGKQYQSFRNDNEDSIQNSKGKTERLSHNSKSSYNDNDLRDLIHNGKRLIIEMESDGNCLFRAISHQLYQDHGSKHDVIRHEVCNYLEKNEKDFGVYLLMDEDEEDVREFQSYVSEMREDGTWGGDVEIVCAARLYRRNIMIFSASGCYSVGFHVDHDSKSPPVPSGPDILLSYHENSHYNCVFDEDLHKNMVKPSKTMGVARRSNHDDVIDSESSTLTASTSTSSEGLESETKTVNHKKNEMCPCGSQLKYKKCCLEKERRHAKLVKHKERYNISKPSTTTSAESSTNSKLSDVLESGFQLMHI